MLLNPNCPFIYEEALCVHKKKGAPTNKAECLKKQSRTYGGFRLVVPHFQRSWRVQLVQNVVGLYPPRPLKMWDD